MQNLKIILNGVGKNGDKRDEIEERKFISSRRGTCGEGEDEETPMILNLKL